MPVLLRYIRTDTDKNQGIASIMQTTPVQTNLKKQTVALLMPVLNESSGVQLTLDSVFASIRLPDEIIIADGGSTDDTLTWVERYRDRGIPLVITANPKVYAGAGRNAAAALTQCDVLLCVDFGNRLDRHWIAEMTAPFEQDPQLDFTAGTSVPLISSDYEFCVAAIHYHLNALLGRIPIIELLSNQQTPSSSDSNGTLQQASEQLHAALQRHGLTAQLPKTLEPGGLGLGVRRSCWLRMGGMPDWLRASEDHLFGRKLMQAQTRYQTCAGARLYHHMRSNPRALFKQMFVYARGNGQTHHKRPLIFKTAGVYLALITCLFLPLPLVINVMCATLLLGLYGYHQGVRKVRIVAGKAFHLQLIPLCFAVLLPRDFGMIAGYFKGCYDWWTDPQYPINYAKYLLGAEGANRSPNE
jgi:glycosyltransferase involved in cell wall biosynthesis